jgi:hypothetical protein
MPNQPTTPKKAPYKGILPSSRYYTTNNENNENLTPENLNAKPVNLAGLLEAVKKHPGNKPLPFSHKNLNYQVPKMKLPAHIKGGRKTRRRRSKRTHTRKH